MRLIDNTLIVTLSNGAQEIERGMAPNGDAAVGLAIMMLARRGDDLRAGDTLRVLSPN
jgi:hypothetical protein